MSKAVQFEPGWFLKQLKQVIDTSTRWSNTKRSIRTATMKIKKNACRYCNGDVQVDYKANRGHTTLGQPGIPKCLSCSRYGDIIK